ncbi:TPA: molecular chaperone [Proteus mirabilis]
MNILKTISLLFCYFIFSAYSYAGLSLSQSRIIFSEGDKSQSVQINNDTDNLYLSQNMVTADLDGKKNEHFIVLPPLKRLDPQSSVSIKILPRSLNQLPSDRESLFFFTAYLIPETKNDQKNNNVDLSLKINMVTKIIIKGFYRPKNLTTTSLDSNAKKIIFKKVGNNVQIDNPTPYYFTISNLKFDGKSYQSANAPMVAPFSSVDLAINKSIKQASWQYINDFGGLSNTFENKIILE